jgi:hypothetical protein
MKPQTLQPLMSIYRGAGVTASGPLTDSFWYTYPPRATEAVYGHFLAAAAVFKALTGKTVKVAYPKKRVSAYTLAEANQRAGGTPDFSKPQGGNLAKLAVMEFQVNVKADDRLFYLLNFHPLPTPACFTNGGGAFMRDWWFPDVPKYPEIAGLCVTLGFKPWTIAGVWPDALQARGAAFEADMHHFHYRTLWSRAHEIGHALGYWEHSKDPLSLMGSGYRGQGATFTGSDVLFFQGCGGLS